MDPARRRDRIHPLKRETPLDAGLWVYIPPVASAPSCPSIPEGARP